jgi:Cys-tRNA(Pro) deacylase
MKKNKPLKKDKVVKKDHPLKKTKIIKKDNFPSTSAILALKKQKIEFSLHPYQYEEKGGTKTSAIKLGVDEHCVIKTLVMEDENGKPLIILMHGDKEVSTKSLAGILGAKSISPCKPEIAEKHTGYKVGGTSPFGIKKVIPVFMEKTIADLPQIFINAGRRGLLAKMSPLALIEALRPFMVNVAV